MRLCCYLYNGNSYAGKMARTFIFSSEGPPRLDPGHQQQHHGLNYCYRIHNLYISCIWRVKSNLRVNYITLLLVSTVVWFTKKFRKKCIIYIKIWGYFDPFPCQPWMAMSPLCYSRSESYANFMICCSRRPSSCSLHFPPQHTFVYTILSFGTEYFTHKFQQISFVVVRYVTHQPYIRWQWQIDLFISLYLTWATMTCLFNWSSLP